MRNLIKKNPKYSKRINYDALKDLFVDGESGDGRGRSHRHRGADLDTDGNAGGLVPLNIDLDDKDEDDLFRIDDKSDGEGALVIEEGGGGVGLSQSGARIPNGVEAGATSKRTSKSQSRPQVPTRPVGEQGFELGDDDAEGEEDVDAELSEKGDDDYTWDDGYEQEV